MKLTANTFSGNRSQRLTQAPFTTSVVSEGAGNRFKGFRCELQLLTDPSNRDGGRDQFLVTGVIPAPMEPAVRELIFSILSHSLTNLYNEGQALLAELSESELAEGLMSYIASGDWIADKDVKSIRPYFNAGSRRPAQPVNHDIMNIITSIELQLRATSFEDDANALDLYNKRVTADLAKSLANTDASALETGILAGY